MKTTTLKEFAKDINNNDFDLLHQKITSLVNAYNESKEDGYTTFYPFENSELETLSDNLILLGAWIQDRLNEYATNPGGKNYSKSLTKKVRKTIGYTL